MARRYVEEIVKKADEPISENLLKKAEEPMMQSIPVTSNKPLVQNIKEPSSAEKKNKMAKKSEKIKVID